LASSSAVDRTLPVNDRAAAYGRPCIVRPPQRPVRADARQASGLKPYVNLALDMLPDLRTSWNGRIS
jgi:hypothetical protein